MRGELVPLGREVAAALGVEEVEGGSVERGGEYERRVRMVGQASQSLGAVVGQASLSIPRPAPSRSGVISR